MGEDLEKIEKEYATLRAKILKLGYVCAGSVMLLYRKCGKSNCACQKNKKAQHGPYYIWTRKVTGKTVTRTLNEQQTKRCLQYIENLKRLNFVLEEMKEVAAQALETEK